MTEHAPEKIFSGINIPKVLAGALAAVCAAVVGSFLGVAGTLIGAAVASVVGSVGTEIYERSLQRGAKKLQTLAPAFVKVPAAIGTPQVAAATEEDSPSHTAIEPAPKRQFRWGHIAAAAAGVFILAMGAITIYEWIAGEPLASAVGASSDSGTTFGNVGNSTPTDERPAPKTSTSPTDAPTGDPTATPTGDATTAPPADAPTTTTAPTDSPTTDSPQSTTDPGAGVDSGSGSGSGGGLDSSGGSLDSGSGGGLDSSGNSLDSGSGARLDSGSGGGSSADSSGAGE